MSHCEVTKGFPAELKGCFAASSCSPTFGLPGEPARIQSLSEVRSEVRGLASLCGTLWMIFEPTEEEKADPQISLVSNLSVLNHLFVISQSKFS